MGADTESGGPGAPGAEARVRIVGVETLSKRRYLLTNTTLDYRHRDGRWSRQERETYDKGHGVAILLYDEQAGTVLLTRQFRLAASVAGHPDGMLIEAVAGMLDGDDPEAAARREVEEETGLRVRGVERLFEAYTSPGALTERLTFFVAPFSASDRVSPGGGLHEDGEDIELLELGLDEALALVERGEIVDAKTIVLLLWARQNLPRLRD